MWAFLLRKGLNHIHSTLILELIELTVATASDRYLRETIVIGFVPMEDPCGHGLNSIS